MSLQALVYAFASWQDRASVSHRTGGQQVEREVRGRFTNNGGESNVLPITFTQKVRGMRGATSILQCVPSVSFPRYLEAETIPVKSSRVHSGGRFRVLDGRRIHLAVATSSRHESPRKLSARSSRTRAPSVLVRGYNEANAQNISPRNLSSVPSHFLAL